VRTEDGKICGHSEGRRSDQEARAQKLTPPQAQATYWLGCMQGMHLSRERENPQPQTADI